MDPVAAKYIGAGIACIGMGVAGVGVGIIFGNYLAAALGAVGWVSGVLPFAMFVALTSLEMLVAFLQAYVFAILTCIYLNDAIHPGH
jgi:F0F1-type ATP synthase membrane subunit a